MLGFRGDFMNKSKIVKLIISLIFVIMSSLMTYKVYSINIIPNKYLLIFILILVILNIIANICLFVKNKWLKIITVLIYLLISIISVIGITYVNETNKFIDNTFSNNEEESIKVNYLLLSKKDYKIDDINNKDIYYYTGSLYNDEAISKLKEKVSAKFIALDDITSIYKNDLFFIDELSYDSLQELYGLNREDYNVIYKIELEIKVDNDIDSEDNNEDKNDSNNNSENNKEESNQKKQSNGSTYNIYLTAYDFSGYRSDLNKIITVNTKKHEILITNIHRFAYVKVDGKEKRNTLSSNGYYGVNVNKKALEKEFGIKIDYYFTVKSPGLVKVVDSLGGIEYCSDQAYTTDHALVLNTYDDTKGNHLKVVKGCQHLNGIETLTVARERLAFYMGATKRDENTSAILEDILNAAKKPSNITRYTSILNSMNGLYKTNVPKNTMTSGIKSLLDEKWTIRNQAVTGQIRTDYINFSNAKGSVYYLNKDSVKECSRKINSLYY